MPQWIRTGILALAVILAAGAGLYLGLGMRERLNPTEVRFEPTNPNPLLGVGEEFPDVPVMTADSAIHPARELLSEGGVVIFMELGCPPCSLMSINWSTTLSSWPKHPIVLGIAYASLEGIARYRDRIGVTFPIASDTGDVYATAFQVTDFPMRLLVDRDGIIRSTTYDCHEVIDTTTVRELLSSGEGVSTTGATPR